MIPNAGLSSRSYTCKLFIDHYVVTAGGIALDVFTYLYVVKWARAGLFMTKDLSKEFPGLADHVIRWYPGERPILEASQL